MWQSVFDVSIFRWRIFFFIHANDAGEEEHPRGAPSPFSMTHLGPTVGPSWAILPDVRGAKSRARASTIPLAEEPLRLLLHPPPPKADTGDKVQRQNLMPRSREDGRSRPTQLPKPARELENLDDREKCPSDRSHRIPASDGKTSRGKSPNVLKSETSIESESPVKRGMAWRYSTWWNRLDCSLFFVSDIAKRRWWAGPSWWDPRTPPVITTDASLYLFSSEIENKQGFLQKWF